MPQSRGYRVKTRKLLTRKGNPGFSDKLLKLDKLGNGSKVLIYIDPRFHKGMPHRRYHGKMGLIVGRRGRAFEVDVMKGRKKVRLVVTPEHLRPL